MKVFSIRLPEDLREEVEKIAHEQGLRPAQVIRSFLVRVIRARGDETKKGVTL